jgi:hypothetical protein
MPVIGRIPGDRDARLQMFLDSLDRNPKFEDAYPYPYHERYDQPGPTQETRDPCVTTDDFVDSFHWEFEVKPGNRLFCTGTRHKFTVAPPVLDPATGHLVFNFYPDGGGAGAITQVDDDDPIFFATVP